MRYTKFVLRIAHDAFLYVFTGYVKKPEDLDYAQVKLPPPPNWLHR